MESGTRFTCENGDIDEGFYNSLDSVLAELARLLVSEGAKLYPRFRERLLPVEDAASNIGWGCCDAVRAQVQKLEIALGAEEETDPQNAPPNERP